MRAEPEPQARALLAIPGIKMTCYHLYQSYHKDIEKELYFSYEIVSERKKMKNRKVPRTSRATKKFDAHVHLPGDVTQIVEATFFHQKKTRKNLEAFKLNNL